MSGNYRTIVADPPWDHSDGYATRSRTSGKWQGPMLSRSLPYSTMSLDDIKGLDVRRFAAHDCRLFLWATNRYLPHAFDVMGTWGFTYKQTLTWHKLDAWLGSIAPNSEFLLVGTRGSPEVKARLACAVIPAAQTKQHSRKPDLFMDLIEGNSPGPYLELFARRQRLGWDTWGNEALNHVEMLA